MESKEVEKDGLEPSRFTGGAFANGGINWLTGFVTLITLGLAYPAMVCWKLRWKANHTFINGRRLYFDGNGAQLMGKYMLWNFLTVITLGIYLPFRRMKMVAWETKHTHFSGVPQEHKEQNPSHFTGKWYQLLGVNWLTSFVTLITLSFGYCWAHCYRERWYQQHKIIDGVEITFDGTATQYFGKRMLWTLLTSITFGIYGFWLAVKSLQWTVSHLNVSDPALVPLDLSVEQAELKAQAKKPVNHMANLGFSLAMTFGVIFLIAMFAFGVATGGEFIVVFVPMLYLSHRAKMLLVFSILGCMFDIASLVCSIIGVKKSSKLEGSGNKLGKAGIALSIIFIFLSISFSIVPFVVFSGSPF